METHRTRLIIIGIVVALIALVVTVQLLLPNYFRRLYIYFNTDVQTRAVNSALESADQGDFRAAQVESWDVVRSSRGGNLTALSVYDTSAFMTGNAASRINAIRATKEHYSRATNDPYTQALQVNKLLGFYNSARENYVYDEIFAGEPFQNFLVPGDKIGSIRKLAEHSIVLSPTTAAIFRLGQWNAEQIERAGTTVSAQERQLYADNILDVIESADKIIDSETVAIEGRPFDYTIKSRYFFWKSYLYSAVARVQPQYLEETKHNLNELVAYYNATRNENGEKYPLIATRLPYAYANYAVALKDIHGEEARAEIESALNALIALIAENPEIHKGEYLALIRRGVAASEIDPEQASANYRALAQMHPPFKAFLESYGWKF